MGDGALSGAGTTASGTEELTGCAFWVLESTPGVLGADTVAAGATGVTGVSVGGTGDSTGACTSACTVTRGSSKVLGVDTGDWDARW